MSLGWGLLFYPIAVGFIVGVAREPHGRETKLAGGLFLLGIVLLYTAVAPRGEFGVQIGSVAIVLVLFLDLLLAYPLYRFGRSLRPEPS